MHTTIDKHKKKPGEHVINEDGLVWTPVMPNDKNKLIEKKYRASIPDVRLDHFDFNSFGWHSAWADTIEELIEDIKSFSVPYYSEDVFLNQLKNKDSDDLRKDMQIELYWDGRGTKITRGKLTINNMTSYTSF